MEMNDQVHAPASQPPVNRRLNVFRVRGHAGEKKYPCYPSCSKYTVTKLTELSQIIITSDYSCDSNNYSIITTAEYI
jgi:hypothetical protein